MPVKHLPDLHPAFAHAYNTGDKAALLALYRPDAIFMAQPGQAVAGLEAISGALDAFLALKGMLQIRVLYLVETADTALVSTHWSLKGTAPDGSPIALEGKSAEVLRQDADGSWRYAIDHPFGAS